MIEHTTIEGTYGPGTYTDTSFIPVPEDAKRLLLHLASITPGFTKDSEVLDAVDFIGDDLPIIPGPIKAQVMVSIPADVSSSVHILSSLRAQSYRQ